MFTSTRAITGVTLAAEGIEQVTENNPNAVESVVSAIKEVAATGTRFTSYEVRELLDTRGVVIENRNVIGAAFNRAARAGLVTMVGVTKSTVPSAHSRLVREWVAA